GSQNIFKFQFLNFLCLFTITFASTEEAIALLKWKATFKNQNNSLLASWTHSLNACGHWYGVTCFNGRVNKLLQTIYNLLNGSISSSLGKLTNLSILYIYQNILFGSIPTEIGDLRSLAYLGLSTTSLNSSIPASLGNLTSLSSLYLHENHISGSIPEEIGYLRSPTSLGLHENHLSDSIPASLGNLTSLSSMYLLEN
ncbi:hypothetical protein MTR67_050851, partial [Solanum verrucosum]